MSFVYVAVNDDGITKIGRSLNPVQRVKAHKGFKLLDFVNAGTHKKSVQMEHFIIKKLKSFLVQGNEWFKMPKEVNPLKTFRYLVRKAFDIVNREDTFKNHYSNQIYDILKRNDSSYKTTPEYFVSRANMYKKILVDEYGYKPDCDLFRWGDIAISNAKVKLGRWSKLKQEKDNE